MIIGDSKGVHINHTRNLYSICEPTSIVNRYLLMLDQVKLQALKIHFCSFFFFATSDYCEGETLQTIGLGIDSCVFLRNQHADTTEL